ncbi:ATP-binding cassette domain-containing protein [Paenibacillus tarimensis]
MIELRHVTKRYGGSGHGLYRESVTINNGEIVAVLGENGSGKTTMLKTIMGIGEIQGGEVLIDGSTVTGQYDKMAFITEEGSYLPDLTPDQFAAFLADFYSGFQMERFQKLSAFFEIPRHLKIKTFSRGQKSKLEICAGFSKGAKYILMDEPFQGKDLFTRRDFLKLMISSLKTDETILITTHLIDEIENVADRAIILRYGQIKADFYIDDMREKGKDLASVMAEISQYSDKKYKQLFE